MRRPSRLFSGLLAFSLLASLLIGFRTATAFQQGDGDLALGIDLPDGVTFDVIAQGVSTAAPAAPAQFRLERLALAPGATGATAPAPGPELYFVESGQLSIIDELGIEAVYDKGQAQFVAQGVAVQIANNGNGKASVLRLSLVPPDAAPSASPAATPVGIPSGLLFDSKQAETIGPPTRLVLARLTFAPGAQLDEHAFSGPVALLAEQGTLAIAGPSGIEGQLKPNKPIVFPTGAQNHERNASKESVSVIVAAALPAQAPLIGSSGSSGVESGGARASHASPVTGSATVRAKSTAAQTATPTATVEPTATPEPTPGVLYSTSGDSAFTDWPTEGQWKQFRGQLLADGTASSITLAPVDLSSVTDYAIEAEIQSAQGAGDGAFFIVARAANGQDGLKAAVDNYGDYQLIVDGDTVAQTGSSLDTQWHDYRLEVRGNVATLYVDGSPVVQATDNRLITSVGGGVGLECDGPMQISVRSFTVTELAD